MVFQFFKLCDRISLRNQNRIRNYLTNQGPRWVQIMGKNRGQKSRNTLPLKGVCHEIFDLQFFSWFEPIWAPDKQAKVFSNGVLISPRIQIFKKLCGVHPSAESSSAVCNTPLSQAPRCATQSGVRLRGVQHSEESDSAV